MSTANNLKHKLFKLPQLAILALMVSTWGLLPGVGSAQNRGIIDGIVIPAGATIVGQYIPAQGGLRYIAKAVTYDRYSYRIDAASLILKDVKDPRDTSTGSILEDAAIGAAGGTILGEIFGDADVEEIIGGAVAGVVVGNVTADRVVVIKPDQTITLYDN